MQLCNILAESSPPETMLEIVVATVFRYERDVGFSLYRKICATIKWRQYLAAEDITGPLFVSADYLHSRTIYFPNQQVGLCSSPGPSSTLMASRILKAIQLVVLEVRMPVFCRRYSKCVQWFSQFAQPY